MRRLFDTNHAIAHLNGAPRLRTRMEAAEAAADTFAITTTVLGELHFGARASQRVDENLARLTAFVAEITVYDFDAAAAEEFGQIKVEQRAGANRYRPRMLRSPPSLGSVGFCC